MGPKNDSLCSNEQRITREGMLFIFTHKIFRISNQFCMRMEIDNCSILKVFFPDRSIFVIFGENHWIKLRKRSKICTKHAVSIPNFTKILNFFFFLCTLFNVIDTLAYFVFIHTRLSTARPTFFYFYFFLFVEGIPKPYISKCNKTSTPTLVFTWFIRSFFILLPTPLNLSFFSTHHLAACAATTTTTRQMTSKKWTMTSQRQQLSSETAGSSRVTALMLKK